MAASRKKYSKRFYSGKKQTIGDLLIMYIGAFFGIGVLIGAVYASIISGEGAGGLYRYADSIIHGTGLYGLDKGTVFKESLFKYGKTAAVLWFLSFVPFGSVISLFVIGVKGASVGFSTALLVRYYNFTGLWYSAILYFPQTVIIVTSYFLLVYYCLKAGTQRNVKKPQNKEKDFSEKLLFLMIASIGVVMGCFFEAYISPGLISVLL